MNAIPKRLGKEPLVEAIWQIQFEPEANQPIGDILHGVLYTALKVVYPTLRLLRLPAADIPAPVAQLDPNLRLVPKFRMESDNSPFLFQTGDHIVTVNCRKPYKGWDAFKEKIFVLIDLVKESGIVPQPQRHSLRYIDLITLDLAPSLDTLQLSLTVGGEHITKLPLQMRLELPDENFKHVVQIVTPAKVGYQISDQAEGTILDIETVDTTPFKGWDGLKEQVDFLHDRSKALFFQRLLTPEAIKRMEPED
ncbi:MAG: TIGR04255 family protein [Azoarcus sp.]|jgi:uncharacterized protein (TIGR04255 family)|nr:TIGR04255 family protein [Azoarcus sp.]